MRLQIESPNIELDANLMDLVHIKFKQLSKQHHRIVNCVVMLRKEISAAQKCFFVEAKVELAKTRLFARNSAETFEIALNSVIDNLEHQLGWNKEERIEIW